MHFGLIACTTLVSNVNDFLSQNLLWPINSEALLTSRSYMCISSTVLPDALCTAYTACVYSAAEEL